MPTVSDRIGQTVVRLYLEPDVEPIFHPNSSGYWPGRSALDAVATCRERCWKKDWMIDLDIRSLVDSLAADDERLLSEDLRPTRHPFLDIALVQRLVRDGGGLDLSQVLADDALQDARSIGGHDIPARAPGVPAGCRRVPGRDPPDERH